MPGRCGPINRDQGFQPHRASVGNYRINKLIFIQGGNPYQGVIVPRPIVIEVAIGIELLASELAGVIAGAGLRADSPKHIVLVPRQGHSGCHRLRRCYCPARLCRGDRPTTNKKGQAVDSIAFLRRLPIIQITVFTCS